MRRSSTSVASRKYHNRVARKYDRIYEDRYWEFHDELTWRTIRPHVPADLSSPCLDLGCGTGKWGLRLLKTGLPTTFVDHAASMIEQTRAKVAELGPKAARATLMVADIVDMPQLESGRYAMVLAMGDPLSICSDPMRAASEMHRLCRPGGVVIATADSKLAGIDHYIEQSDLDGLERFVRTGRTRWLTDKRAEQFELQTFTPTTLRKLFERAGFEVTELRGKTVLPLRKARGMLESAGAMDALLRLEEELAREPASAGRASHLQITARKT